MGGHWDIPNMASEPGKSIWLGRDFPGGLVVKNPPSSVGDMGSIPDQGIKIPHAMGH